LRAKGGGPPARLGFVKIFGRKSREELPSPVVTVATDSGMLALWRESAFADVTGYDVWETRVNE
jgi:hypothetical protein